VKIPGSTAPLDVVLVHPIDIPNDQPGHLPKGPKNKYAEEAYAAYMRRFPQYSAAEFLCEIK
jgi:hypothetical protein